MDETTCEKCRNTKVNDRSTNSLKVAIIGATGNTGKTMALCLKQSPLIDELAIYDSRPFGGLLMELRQMDTKCRTMLGVETASVPRNKKMELERALKGAKIVMLVTEPSKQLCEQAREVESVVAGLLHCCPKAFVGLVSPWVSSLLPMLFELYKKDGLFQCDRLFGVLNLFSTRANSLAAETLGVNPEFVVVPILGGGCPETCVPLFSCARPCAEFTPEELARLRHAMKSTPYDESSSLCAGYAAARFCISLCKALRDERGVLECAYVRSCLVPELKYVGAPLELGPSGVQRHLGVPRLSNSECDAMFQAIPRIKHHIALGESLALGCGTSTETCPLPARCDLG
ncbi:malate dehydrogenase, mitochondrial-like [Phymastichus coffea]|uniref:malate dehydrogenase, mitochondrial-like n=1 Tax=Phymastichus coffea TaxID=108790 RepID=UPI00273AF608|nr:malate dehydrogenase, mitochondrial-like [Phymastichus coffea]